VVIPAVEERPDLFPLSKNDNLRKIVREVIEVFGDEYLRAPNDNDTAKLPTINERRGFPRMLESVDCMH
jgi:hypothetical protein